MSILLALQISAYIITPTAFAQTRTALPVAHQNCADFAEYQDIVTAYKVQGDEPAERVEAKFNAKKHFTDELTRDEQYDVIACSLKSGEFHLFMAPYMIRYFVEVIIQLAGLVCVLFIIIGAYQYLLGSVTENKQKGKDTSRFKKAGARQVLWLKAHPQGLRQGLKEAISKFSKTRGLIIEGTSVLKYLKPDLAILLKREGLAWKPSAKAAIKKIDLVLDSGIIKNTPSLCS